MANFKHFVDLLCQRDEVQIDDQALLRFLDMFPIKRRFTVKDFTEELARWMRVEKVLGARRKTVAFLVGKRLRDEEKETIALIVARQLQRKVMTYAKEEEVHNWVDEAGFALGVQVRTQLRYRRPCRCLHALCQHSPAFLSVNTSLALKLMPPQIFFVGHATA